MQPWTKKKGLMRAPKYVTTLEPIEREVLGNLAATVSEALIHRVQSAPKDELAELTGLTSGHKEAPEDPALARLLPDFERAQDEEFEGDNALLRSIHEPDICKEKITNLQSIIMAMGPDGGVHVSITEEEAHSWLSALNDLRLYVSAGTSMAEDVRLMGDAEQLVEWLAYNQDSLLDALTDS